MHQIDSGVIISFMKASLRNFRECVEIPLGMAGAAATKLTNRLRRLLGKERTASGHLMNGACDYRHLLLLLPLACLRLPPSAAAAAVHFVKLIPW